MAKPTSPHKKKDIEQYKHKDKTRLNNPQVGMVSQANDPDLGKKKYSYDPHLDPTLVWTGKKEQEELEVDTVSIHVHERIDPKTIVQQVHKQNVKGYQHNLFEETFDHRPVRDEVSFYQHKNAWANRLIAGDSMLVMNSLLEKEGMAGQVQMVYIDPPYGIRYKSNFQPFVGQSNVSSSDKDQDLNVEPEMLKAFRDTWQLGIHSYLGYLRDRLLLSRELLNETGSVFVQISDENVHLIRNILDDIFGRENFVAEIVFRKKGMTLGSKTLETMNDFIVWYAKDINKIKYHQLYEDYSVEGASRWTMVEEPNGKRRKLTTEEYGNHSLLPKGSKVFRLVSQRAPSFSANNVYDFEFEGVTYKPPGCWVTGIEGMQRLAKANRFYPEGNNLSYIQYHNDFPYKKLTNLWGDTSGANNKVYVVQTSEKPLQRCLLMCTDPGDLVIDPTSGSGTTAAVSEQWGRRWIAIDTSRIAVQLSKQRLMTSTYDWYKLAYEADGVAGGFLHKGYDRTTLRTIANNEPPEKEIFYDTAEIDRNIVRVAGPFTVEAIPAITVKSLEDINDTGLADNSIARTGETARQDDWRSELLKTGVRTKGGEKIEFARVELLQGTRYLHAEAETLDGKRALISFGPDHAPLEQKQIELALEEAQHIKPSPSLILFAAFQFDPEAAKDVDETNWAGVDLLKVQMNTDLLTSDLKRSQSSSESFWLVGQPDVQVSKDQSGKYIASVNGFDYYNPKSGEVTSGGKKEIAMWMLDTDYDGRSIFPTQVFFPMAGAKDGWNKLAKNLKAELDEELLDKFEGTESIPFEVGEYRRCAVKIIDNRGIESFCVKNLE